MSKPTLVAVLLVLLTACGGGEEPAEAPVPGSAADSTPSSTADAKGPYHAFAKKVALLVISGDDEALHALLGAEVRKTLTPEAMRATLDEASKDHGFPKKIRSIEADLVSTTGIEDDIGIDFPESVPVAARRAQIRVFCSGEIPDQPDMEPVILVCICEEGGALRVAHVEVTYID